MYWKVYPGVLMTNRHQKKSGLYIKATKCKIGRKCPHDVSQIQ